MYSPQFCAIVSYFLPARTIELIIQQAVCRKKPRCENGGLSEQVSKFRHGGKDFSRIYI